MKPINSSGKSKLSNLLWGLLLISLLFISYIYFNRTESGSVASRIKNLLSINEMGPAEIDEGAATDSNIAGAMDEKLVPGDNANTVWVATDYKKGDIQSGQYVVKHGDTLWEIAEAVYGDGTQWHKILDANKDKVGFLPNGSQALIITGQTLILP